MVGAVACAGLGSAAFPVVVTQKRIKLFPEDLLYPMQRSPPTQGRGDSTLPTAGVTAAAGSCAAAATANRTLGVRGGGLSGRAGGPEGTVTMVTPAGSTGDVHQDDGFDELVGSLASSAL